MFDIGVHLHNTCTPVLGWITLAFPSRQNHFFLVPTPDLPLQSPGGYLGDLRQLASPHQSHHVPLHRHQHLHDHQGQFSFNERSRALSFFQVMRTVLGYFLAYSPLIVAFAIAFHILLPGSRAFGYSFDTVPTNTYFYSSHCFNS